MERDLTWEHYTDEERGKVFSFAEDYRQFISECKTERECVDRFTDLARAAGFTDMEEIKKEQRKLEPGDKVYAVNQGKAMALFVVGYAPIEEGMNILGAHIDSPRLDLKQNPLYEDTGLAMLDTHYYGGVKKYQWVTLPLALHGECRREAGRSGVRGQRSVDPSCGRAAREESE